MASRFEESVFEALKVAQAARGGRLVSSHDVARGRAAVAVAYSGKRPMREVRGFVITKEEWESATAEGGA